ncbi:MAG: 2-C-methyl-D-erythritol 4-phosphate cytidylyltransferase [Clostridia bacterium]|nr:2-C-methyl-D-erythritol 4-phosphate cytidylyltransferase [Clostridia bacterium]
MSFSSVLNGITDRINGIYTKYNSAIILAGGSSTRIGGHKTKQLMPIMGVPTVVRTVSVFEKCKFIDEIIIVAKGDEMSLYDEWKKRYGWEKVTKIVLGGADRQASVLNGFKSISDKSDFVYIHDGARCLITEEMIRNVGHAACIHGAAIAAQKATDTVKVIDGKKLSTIDRNNVWLAQTPQVFMTEMYRAAAYSAKKDGTVATDDASLVEAIGFEVVPVDCGKENMKITSPCDFAIAEAILKFRESEEKI